MSAPSTAWRTAHLVRVLAVLTLHALAVTTADTASSASGHDHIPLSPANRVVAENLHATDQAFIEVHHIVQSLTHAYHAIRGRTESACLNAVRAFDYSAGDATTLMALVRQLSEQLVAEMSRAIIDQHAEMDGLIEIAVELHDTNLVLCSDVPAVQEAMQMLQGLRETRYGQVDTLLADLRRDIGRVCDQALAQAKLETLSLQRLRDSKGAVDATAAAAARGRLESIVLSMLDQQRAIVLVNRACSQTMMTALEHQFRSKSLELTLAEQRAHKRQELTEAGDVQV